MANDNLGRNVGQSTNQEIAAAMLQNLPRPIEIRQTDEDREKQQELIDAVHTVEETFREQSDAQIASLTSILKEVQSLLNRRTQPRASTTRSTVSGSDIDNSVGNAVSQSVRKANTQGRVVGGSGGGGGGGTIIPVTGGGGGKGGGGTGITNLNTLGFGNLSNMLASTAFYALSGAFTAFMTNTGVELGSIFDGIIREEFEFSTQIRKAVNETRSFGKELSTTTDQYLKFGDVVEETGHNRTEFQKAWIQNARKGLGFEMRAGKLQQKSATDQIRMLKNALNVSFELDMNAQSTAEMFDSWSRDLQLSNTQLFTIGLSMKQIARETGISGENMMQVAKSVETTAKLLKKSAALSHETMSTMLRSAALATKFGVQDLTQEIDQGLISLDHFYNMSDKNLQAFMARALNRNQELWGALQAGVAGSDRYRPAINAAMMDEMKRSLAQAGLPNVDPTQIVGEVRSLELELEDAKLANDQALVNQLESQLRNLRMIPKFLGMELGDMQALALKMQEESKTPLQRIDELNQELTKAKNDVRRESLLADITEIKQLITQRAIATYTEMANLQGRSIEEAIQKTRTDLIRSGSIKESDPFGVDEFRGIVQQNLKNLEAEANRLGNVDFTKELQLQNFNSTQDLLDSFLSNDTDERKRAQTAMEELANKIGVDQSVEQNPVMQLNQWVKEINENIRTISSAFIFSLTAGSLASVIGIGTALTTGGGILGSVQAFRGLNKLLAGRGVSTATSSVSGSLLQKGAQGGWVLPTSSSGGGLLSSGWNKMKNLPSLIGGQLKRLPGLIKLGFVGGIGLLTRALQAIPGLISLGFSGGIGLLRRSWQIIPGLIKLGFSGGFGMFRRMFGIFPMLISALGQWRNIPALIWSAVSGIGRLISTAIKGTFIGLPKLLGGLVKGGGLLKLGLQGGKAALGASTLGVATAVFAAVEGAIGAWQGYTRTADVFADSLKNVDGTMREATLGMKFSSTAAGGIVGVLDSLSFGLLRLTGIFDPLQKTLSHWIYFFVGLVESFIGGIKEGIKAGLNFEWVQNALTSLKEAWQFVKKSFISLGNAFGFAGDSVSAVIDSVQNKLGPAFEFVGWLLGTVVGGAIGLLIKGLSWLVWILGGLIKSITWVIDGIKNLGSNLRSLFDGIANLPSLIAEKVVSLAESIGNVFTEIPGLLFDGLKGALAGAWDWFMGYSKEEDINAAVEESSKQLVNTTQGHEAEMTTKLAAISDPTLRKQEIEDQLQGLEVKVSGVRQNIEMEKQVVAQQEGSVSRRLLNLGGLTSWGNTGLDAANTALGSSESQLQILTNRQATLEAELKKLNESAEQQTSLAKSQSVESGITAETMKRGQQKGSIYVHDTHCEAVLIMILEALTGKRWNQQSVDYQQALVAEIESREGIEPSSVLNTGAFAPKEGSSALWTGIQSFVSEKLGFPSEGESLTSNQGPNAVKAIIDEIKVIQKILLGETSKISSQYVGMGAFDGQSVVRDAQSNYYDGEVIRATNSQFSMSSAEDRKKFSNFATNYANFNRQNQLKITDHYRSAKDSSYVGMGAFDSMMIKNAQIEIQNSSFVGVENNRNEQLKNSIADRQKSVSESNYVGLGAFSSSMIRSAQSDAKNSLQELIFDQSTTVGKAASALFEKLDQKRFQEVDSSTINTGAFKEKSVNEAYTYDDLNVKMAEISAKDFNNVIQSIRSDIVRKPQGGATRALYITDNGTDEEIDNSTLATNGIGDVDNQLLKSFVATTNNNRSVSVGASMFTPEDAAEYVMQQMAGATPSSSESLGSLEYITQLAEERNITLVQVLEEMKKFNRLTSVGSAPSLVGTGIRAKEHEGQTVMNRYQRELIRGNWEDLQAIAANSQENLQNRPR